MLDIKIRADVGRWCWTTLDDIHFTVLVVNRYWFETSEQISFGRIGQGWYPSRGKDFRLRAVAGPVVGANNLFE